MILELYSHFFVDTSYFAQLALPGFVVLDLGRWPRLSHFAPLALRTESLLVDAISYSTLYHMVG
jgi:hypothetical protein